MQGKKVVVIGGSSGMGLAVAQEVVQQGGHVVIASRSLEKLEKAKDAISDKVEIYTLDVTDEQAMSHFFTKVGQIDHIVCTAAAGPTGKFMELDTQEAKKTFESKFWGQYHAAKYGSPYLNEGGSIVFCTGFLSRRPMDGVSILSCANGAIEALAKALALELKPMRVNVISPGIVDTPLYDAMAAKDRLDYMESTAQQLPVQKIGKAEDIAHAAMYLMTNSYTTGTILDVDGGQLLI